MQYIYKSRKLSSNLRLFHENRIIDGYRLFEWIFRFSHALIVGIVQIVPRGSCHTYVIQRSLRYLTRYE